jgi:hypothetical protein
LLSANAAPAKSVLTHFANTVCNDDYLLTGQATNVVARTGRRIGGPMQTTQTHISDEEIARRAYEIWQSRGCPATDGQEDWEAAKAELTATRIGRNGSTQQRLQTWWQRVRQKIAG